jgi:hypothetical protein
MSLRMRPCMARKGFRACRLWRIGGTAPVFLSRAGYARKGIFLAVPRAVSAVRISGPRRTLKIHAAVTVRLQECCRAPAISRPNFEHALYDLLRFQVAFGCTARLYCIETVFLSDARCRTSVRTLSRMSTGRIRRCSTECCRFQV